MLNAYKQLTAVEARAGVPGTEQRTGGFVPYDTFTLFSLCIRRGVNVMKEHEERKEERERESMYLVLWSLIPSTLNDNEYED